MDGSHDAEDEAGLQHPDEVSGALALVAGHKLLPGLGNEDGQGVDVIKVYYVASCGVNIILTAAYHQPFLY